MRTTPFFGTIAGAAWLAGCYLLLGPTPVRPADKPAAPPSAPSPASATNAPKTRVTVALRDGCLIVGHLAAPTLAFESQLLGKMQVPLERLSTIQFPTNQPALVKMGNRDSMKANLVDKELRLQTAFGELKVPVPEIAEMRFSNLQTNAVPGSR